MSLFLLSPMQYLDFNTSLQPRAPNFPCSNLPEFSFPLLPISIGSPNLICTSLLPSILPLFVSPKVFSKIWLFFYMSWENWHAHVPLPLLEICLILSSHLPLISSIALASKTLNSMMSNTLMKISVLWFYRYISGCFFYISGIYIGISDISRIY